MFAAHHGHAKGLQDLVKANANGSFQNESEDTALIISAYSGQKNSAISDKS